MLGQAILKRTSADNVVNNEKKVSLKSDLEKEEIYTKTKRKKQGLIYIFKGNADLGKRKCLKVREKRKERAANN